MKNYILIGLLFGLFFIGCHQEDDLTPSFADKSWVDSLDLNNPRVKNYYEKYGFGLLTKFDIVRDLRYSMSTTTTQNYWNKLLAKKMDRTTEIDSAITFFNESLFQYFTNEEFVRDYFPKRILLTRELILDHFFNEIRVECKESDARVNANGNNSLHSIFNKSSFAFSVKLGTIYYNEANYNDYKMDNLYMFIVYLFEMNDLYDAFGSDFYLSELARCYGREMTGPGGGWLNLPVGIYVEDGGSLNDLYADKYWYWNKGFVSTAFLNPVEKMGVNAGKIQIKSQNGITSEYVFPDKKWEVRTLINQLLFVTPEVWDSYPEVVKNRFTILMGKFDEWGIDIRSINPVIKNVYPRK